MAKEKTQAELYRELILQLPGVIDSELNFDGGELRELHVLADDTRTAKQVARNIQSALKAKYKTDIDHKLISVAQISSQMSAKRSEAQRLAFEGLELCLTNAGCSVRVRLSGGEQTYAADTRCDGDKLDRYRAIQSATVGAINSYLGSDSVSAKDIRAVDMSEGAVVVATVNYKSGGRSELLSGSCLEDENQAVCVVRATLDALNRRLSVR